MLVRQRTQTINALRGHLAEHGIVAPQGIPNLKRLAVIPDDPEIAMPSTVREPGRLYMEQIDDQNARITELEKRLRDASHASDALARLRTMPGIGQITAVAIESFAPDLRTFRCGRGFSAWLGLVPRQHSTGASRGSTGCRRSDSAISDGF